MNPMRLSAAQAQAIYEQQPKLLKWAAVPFITALAMNLLVDGESIAPFSMPHQAIMYTVALMVATTGSKYLYIKDRIKRDEFLTHAEDSRHSRFLYAGWATSAVGIALTTLQCSNPLTFIPSVLAGYAVSKYPEYFK